MAIQKRAGASGKRAWQKLLLAPRSLKLTLAMLMALLLATLTLPAVALAAECTDTWTGPAEGSWKTAADWSAGHAPTSTEVACIGSGKTVNVNEAEGTAGSLQDEGSLVISSYVLNLANSLETSSINTLTVHNSGWLIGPGTVDISGTLNLEAESTMSGSGSTVILPGATASATMVTGAAVSLREGRKLINEGKFTLTSGRIEESETTVIENTGTFNANSETSHAIKAEGTKTSVINTGTFRKASGTGTTEVTAKVENKGVVDAEKGTLEFTGGGSSSGSNHWEASEGAKVYFDGSTFSLNSGSLSGRIKDQASTLDVEGVTGTAAELEVSSGTLNVQGGSMTVKSLTQNFSDHLIGSGTLEISGTFNWEAESTMSGSGSTVILPGATATITNGGGSVAVYLEGRKLVNEGKATFTSGFLEMSEGAVLENKGTFNANSEASSERLKQINAGAGGSTIINKGTFRKTAGTGTTSVSVPLENYETLKEESGTLDIEHPITKEHTDEFSKGCKGGDPVNCATGDFSETQTDIEIGGRGVGLDLTRTYSAESAATASSPGAFGYGWTNSFSDHLVSEESGKKITAVQGDGSTVPFTESGKGTFTPPVWSQDTLSGTSEAGYTLTLSEQTKYQFSGAGKLEKVTDRNGNETTLAYNKSGQLETITDPAGRKITLTYNGEGLVESAKDPMGHVVKYAYEGKNLTSVTMPGETEPSWKFKYDGSHRMTTMTNGRGGKTTNEYDSSNRVISQTDPAERTTTFEYAPFQTKVTNKATGAVTLELFTSNNEPYSITRGYGTPVATTEAFTYNSEGRVLSETDGNGHKTTYTYDSHGDRTSMTNADEDETKWTYDETHDVETETTPGGEKTTITRNSHGDPETISRPAPGKTTQTTNFTYNSHGQVESMTNPLSKTWKFEYDSAGDRTAEIDPESDKRTWAYNEDSQVTSMVSPRGNETGAKPTEYTTSFERNAQGQLLKVTDPLGHETKYTYDADGNLETITDPNTHKTKYTYDADNELTKVEKPNGNVMETEYDGAGQIKSQTDGNKHTTTYVRNLLEEPTEIKDPLGRVTKEEYDAAGNLTKLIDPAKRETTCVYDPANRLKEVSYSESGTHNVKYEYNADGDLTHMSDGTGESTFTFDQLDRLTESKDGHGDTVGYEYNLGNQQTKITYPNGKSVVQEFDNAGRLKSVMDWLEHTTKFAYNRDSQLNKITFPSATSNVDTYAYSHADLMTEAKMAKGETPLASLVYARNKAGLIETTTSKGLPGAEKTSYTYDENNRLTKAGTASYEYDAANNLTKAPGTTNTYDKADELEKGTNATYTYDEMGERTKMTPSVGPATTYGYNQAGYLTSVKRPKEGETSEINDSYAYNGTGTRTSQIISGTTRYLTWDTTGGLPLMLNDGTNSYIYGPGGLPAEQISSAEAPTYYHHDQLGSTRMLTNASGEAIATFSYGPFGALEGSTGTQKTPLGYGGQYTDADTGLQYLRARYYDPTTGQFLTRDPITPVTREPYGYALENPVGKVDPSGYCGVESGEEIVESINPFSSENCAYQGAEALNRATGIDLPGTLTQPAVVDIAAGVICATPGLDAGCTPALYFAFGDSTASVLAEGFNTQFCNLPHLLAEEGINTVLLGFGGLGLKSLEMAGDAPGFGKALLRGGPALAQGALDIARHLAHAE